MIEYWPASGLPTLELDEKGRSYTCHGNCRVRLAVTDFGSSRQPHMGKGYQRGEEGQGTGGGVASASKTA